MALVNNNVVLVLQLFVCPFKISAIFSSLKKNVLDQTKTSWNICYISKSAVFVNFNSFNYICIDQVCRFIDLYCMSKNSCPII